ncbi:MAG TPA: TetR/AcrR family transcriptional regulator [Phenylobacterium sp.]|nr:TetR/AcrR family transcriptional regulator [Phenylobacterium sp.]
MSRAVGQIDHAKSEAILDAAMEILAARGLTASIEEIARQARVSKQTVYNRFRSKAGLVEALVERRVAEITAPLEAPRAAEHPEEALAGFARMMLDAAATPRSAAFVRLYVQAATDMPDLARAYFEAGPRTSRRRLAQFLAEEHRAGRMVVEDPAMAAEFFAGMVIGSYQTGLMLGVDVGLDAAGVERISAEAARRFMKAYGA